MVLLWNPYLLQVAAISLDSKEMDEEEEEEEKFVDIDAENEGDPNLAPNYAAQIFTYFKEKEVRLNPINQAGLFGQSQDGGGLIDDWMRETLT